MKGSQPASSHSRRGKHVMKKFLTLLAFVLALVATPAFAQERGWSGLASVRYNGEGYYADIAATRADGVATLESLGLARWDNGTGFFVAVDIWNMEAIEDRSNARCAVHETDGELEIGQSDLIGSVDGRLKVAYYELCGDDIVSLRGALDYPLWGPFSATTSVEVMSGAAELVVVKPFAPAFTLTRDAWTFYGDVGPGYNTLNNEWVAPWNARVTYSFGRTTIGVFARGYVADQSDATGGVLTTYRFGG